MSKTFYVNTATPQTTIALFEGSKVLADHRWKSEMNESEHLQSRTEALLRSQGFEADDIRQLVVCVGPGGFTSTRVGVAAVNAWAFAKDLPVATVTVFDLYKNDNVPVIISANAHEAWVKWPGKDAEFLSLEQVSLPEVFEFGGILHENWKTHFESQGGKFKVLEERLPMPETLKFHQEIVKPWYYKDAHITWSDRIHSKRL